MSATYVYVTAHKCIHDVDPWDVFYGCLSTNFIIQVGLGGKKYKPVFYLDETNHPTDFEGWNDAK